MKLAKRSLLGAVVIGIILSLLIVGIDTSWGKVDVRLGKLISDNGSTVNYKIYIPRTATAGNPAPGFL